VVDRVRDEFVEDQDEVVDELVVEVVGQQEGVQITASGRAGTGDGRVAVVHGSAPENGRAEAVVRGCGRASRVGGQRSIPGFP
jgi:hypothetical protein